MSCVDLQERLGNSTSQSSFRIDTKIHQTGGYLQISGNGNNEHQCVVDWSESDIAYRITISNIENDRNNFLDVIRIHNNTMDITNLKTNQIENVLTNEMQTFMNSSAAAKSWVIPKNHDQLYLRKVVSIAIWEK